MKLVQSLAADYWINNTEKIYDEGLHISTPVMEAYEAGFREALAIAALIAEDEELPKLPDEDDGELSSYDKYVKSNGKKV